MTIDELRTNGILAYEYVRGSQLYNTALPPINGVEQSDTDYGGVYIAPKSVLMGLPELYEPQVSDEKNDTTFYELGRWVELLMKANPNALESLYVPQDKVVGEIHPAIQLILDNRDIFVTKECFNSLCGYAVSQIKKCRGLNKKCVQQPMVSRKEVLDFCFVPYKQGSTHVTKWLADNGLKQKYCGLVALPNMHDVYGLYYDFGTHIICEYGVDLRDTLQVDRLYMKLNDVDTVTENDKLFMKSFLSYSGCETIYEVVPTGYHGIVSENADSNSVRFESIAKGETPLVIMTFNQSGYESHCKKYKEYQEWVQKRNPVRYESNLKSNYDCKNVAHCVRLLHMGKELAEGKGFNVVRTWDRQMLLDIRNHKYEYEEIMTYVEELFNDVKQKIETCTLPETVDKEKVNELLIKARELS